MFNCAERGLFFFFFKLSNESLRSISPIKPNEGWSSGERFKGVLRTKRFIRIRKAQTSKLLRFYLLEIRP